MSLSFTHILKFIAMSTLRDSLSRHLTTDTHEGSTHVVISLQSIFTTYHTAKVLDLLYSQKAAMVLGYLVIFLQKPAH